MGTVYVDSTTVGWFEPQYSGTIGHIFVDNIYVGIFTLATSGHVFVDAVDVGDYIALQPPITVELDARYRTRIWLNTYIDRSKLTKDDGVTPASYVVIYENPDYPLSTEFYAPGNNDIVFCVGTPETEVLPLGIEYIEKVPITIWCIDKSNVTGTKIRWTAERELRRVAKNYSVGSLRILDRLTDNEQHLGSTTLYSVTYVLRYKRYA